MKKILLPLMLVLCLAAPALSQVAGPPAWIVGIDARGNLPMGDFSDVASFGVGGTVYAGYQFSPMFAVTARTGYIFTGGKEIPVTVTAGTGTVKTNYGVVPILGGVKAYFLEGDSHIYLGAEAGLYLLSASYTATGALGSTLSSASDSDSKFGFAPAVGAQFRAGRTMMVDAHVDYTMIPMDENQSDLSWVGFAIGLEWTLE